MKKLFIFLLLVMAVKCYGQGVGNRPYDRLPKGGISLAASANILLGTTDNGTETFYPNSIVIAVQSSNYTALVTPAVISIGYNSPNYNNILSGFVLTGIYVQGLCIQPPLTAAYNAIPPNTQVYVKVTPIVGTGTSITAHITLSGDYHN